MQSGRAAVATAVCQPHYANKQKHKAQIAVKSKKWPQSFAWARAIHWNSAPAAWECLSVGMYDEACAVSEKENDIVCWAAALCLSGDTRKALLVIESFVIATSVVVFEGLYHNAFKGDELSIVHTKTLTRHNEVALSWLAQGAQKRHVDLATTDGNLSEDIHLDVVLRVMDLCDWVCIHRWYLIALFLHRTFEEDGMPYTVPDNLWFRYFFSIGYVDDDMSENDERTEDRELPEIDLDTAISAFISQCDEPDVHFITAVTSFKLKRYRTCMMSTSLLIESYATDNATSTPVCRFGDSDLNYMRYIRCMCALQIGERTQAAVDITFLLKRKHLLVSVVGSALALYGLPLEDAEEVVLLNNLDDSRQCYVYCLAEYIHALTLAQLGEMESALSVAREVIPLAPHHDLKDYLADLITIVATAQENSTIILETDLNLHRLLYVALAPAFFGGLCKGGIRVKANSSTCNLLYPQSLHTYSSVSDVLPLHMNRAFFLFFAKRYVECWDELCCAVAAADEIVGSIEFAFTDCFPLRVYFFGCHVALELLDFLLHEEVEAATQCLLHPGDAALAAERDRILAQNDDFGMEVLSLSEQWMRQMQSFYPNSVLAELGELYSLINIRDKQMLSKAILLSRRYPNNVFVRNALTLALYYDNHVPEALDCAQKNLQDFPHCDFMMLLHEHLQRKRRHVVYFFNYRTVVPLRYIPELHHRSFTKRMIISIVLLVANCLIVALTIFLNIPQYVSIPGPLREMAVRLQLPSVVPLFFAGVFLIHAIVAACSKRHLIAIVLQDNFFVNNGLNRFLFCMRGMALINVVNALQISISGNNFLIDNTGVTVLIYLVLTFLFMPFTSRLWFIASVNEPKVGVLSWLTLLAVDTAIAFVVVLPHMVLAVLEPFMSIIFFFFVPSVRPTESDVSTSIRKRLLYHEHHRYRMPPRFVEGSMSQFVHIKLLSFLYYKSHSNMETQHIADQQLQEELYRAFPLITPELMDEIPFEPLRPRSFVEELFAKESARRAQKRAALPATEKDDTSSGATAASPLQALSRTSSRLSSKQVEVYENTRVMNVNMVDAMKEEFGKDESPRKLRRFMSFMKPTTSEQRRSSQATPIRTFNTNTPRKRREAGLLTSPRVTVSSPTRRGQSGGNEGSEGERAGALGDIVVDTELESESVDSASSPSSVDLSRGNTPALPLPSQGARLARARRVSLQFGNLGAMHDMKRMVLPMREEDVETSAWGSNRSVSAEGEEPGSCTRYTRGHVSIMRSRFEQRFRNSLSQTQSPKVERGSPDRRHKGEQQQQHTLAQRSAGSSSTQDGTGSTTAPGPPQTSSNHSQRNSKHDESAMSLEDMLNSEL